MKTKISFNISEYSTNQLYFSLRDILSAHLDAEFLYPNNVKPANFSKFMAPSITSENSLNYFEFTKSLRITDLNQELDAAEKLYGNPFLGEYIFSDRWLADKSREEIRLRILQYVRFWEHFFERFRPNYFIAGGISGAYQYIAHAVSRHYGVTPLYLFGSQVPGHFSITSQPSLYRNRRTWLTLPDREAIRASVDGYLATVFAKGGKVDLDQGLLKTASFNTLINRDNVSRALSKVARLESPRRILTALATKLTPPVRWRLAQRYFQLDFHPGSVPFVYYPLHFQPEASTLVWAPYFDNQLALLENISKSLPVGMSLVVKEHVVGKGTRPLSFYRRLTELKNIVILSPEFDGMELVRHAHLVLTTSGTTAWEALLLKKHPIIFGNYWLEESRHVTKVTDLTTLKHQICRLLDQDFEADDDWYRFVYQEIKSCYPGVFNEPKSLPRVLDPENVRLIADALLEEFNHAPRAMSTAQGR